MSRPPERRPKPRTGRASHSEIRTPHRPAGYAARALAVELLDRVLTRGRSLDDAVVETSGADLGRSDRALARLIAATVLRRRGRLDVVLARFIEKPLPKQRGKLTPILLSAAAQMLFLGTPPHAAINVAVDQCRHDRDAGRFAKLANAVLRRVAAEGPTILSGLDPVVHDIPQWMLARWSEAYGTEAARAIAAASLEEAALDLTLKPGLAESPDVWAGRLGGTLLTTGTIRLLPDGPVPDLPGFDAGAWWVQDAAASLPHRLLGDVAGKRIVDLCAAPGGKTAALAAAGADVTAVDISEQRLSQVAENLARLGLSARCIVADATTYAPDALFDGVLLDAPCTATGTLRRHPDILHLKRSGDVAKLADLQARLLDHAATLVAPGGTLVYCTCSLEPEEGSAQITRFLATAAGHRFRRRPVVACEIGADARWIDTNGDLRTLPHLLDGPTPRLSGLDGFNACRLVASG
jgi:16S rRNA (cytosine967-C5)-methyltransferase